MKKELRISAILILIAVSGAFVLDFIVDMINRSRPAPKNEFDGFARALDGLFLSIDAFMYYVVTWLAGTWLGSAFFAIRKNRKWALSLFYTAIGITLIAGGIVLVGEI